MITLYSMFTVLNADVEKAVDVFFKAIFYGLIFLVFFIPLALAVRFFLSMARESKIANTSSKIRKLGVSEVVLRAINKEQVDDTVKRAFVGHILAGDLGMIAGAASGGAREKMTSMTFWIRYKDGSKETIDLTPKDHLCGRLLQMIDDQDFSDW